MEVLGSHRWRSKEASSGMCDQGGVKERRVEAKVLGCHGSKEQKQNYGLSQVEGAEAEFWVIAGQRRRREFRDPCRLKTIGAKQRQNEGHNAKGRNLTV